LYLLIARDFPSNERSAANAGPEIKAQELQRAFDVFNQVSQELTQAYEALQGRVESLTAELAVANGELRRQYQEKEALSERLPCCSTPCQPGWWCSTAPHGQRSQPGGTQNARPGSIVGERLAGPGASNRLVRDRCAG
jgi:hypothetical protein